MDTKVKVLFVIWALERGGAERFLVSLLKAIDKNRVEPTVCCLNWKGEWAPEVERAGIEVIALNKKRKIDLSVLLKLVRIMKKERFYIVNTYLWGADVVGRIAAILAGVPVIISTVQNVDVWKRWHHIIIDKILASRTDMFIAVSEAVRDYCNKRIGIPLKKIVVIPNAVEVERFQSNGHNEYLYNELNLNENDFILSCIARLTEQKGQRYLLQSISRLRSKFPNLRVIFAGEGEDKEILEKMAQELGVIDNVRFLGQRQDIPEILHLSDGVVLPSLYEGLPVCVVEAMAVGKPVIATAVGGTPEIVYDKETGFLIPPADVYALEKAIEELISLPDRGESIGRKAKEMVMERFSIDVVSRETESLFISLMGGDKCGE